MASVATRTTNRWHWRTIAFKIFTGLFSLQACVIGLFLIAPYPWQSPNLNAPWITKWHSAQSAMGLGIFSGVLLLALLWRPHHKPVLMQLFIFQMITGIIIAILRIPILGFDGWVNFALVAVIIALYPAPRALWSLQREGKVSTPLMVLTLIVGVLLLPDVWRNLHWQLAGVGDESARRFFWFQTVFFITTLVLAGALTALKRPGWRILGILTGLVCIYMGAVALTIPNEAGSWGTVGGILALGAGIGYLGLTVWEARRAEGPSNP